MEKLTENSELLLICIENPNNKKGLTIGKTYKGSGCSIYQDEIWVHINDKGNNRRYLRKWFKVKIQKQ